MRRRQFLSRSLAFSAMAGLSTRRAFAEQPPGWDQVPGILARIVPPVFPDRDFDITEFGARGDGVTDSNPALVAAIAACSEAGGGRVVVPRGIYLSNGPIHLLSNVNLSLADQATILFGVDPEDYLPLVEVRWQGIRCYNYSPLIYAVGQENIAVTGPAAGSALIDGQAVTGWGLWGDSRQDEDWAVLQSMANDGLPVEERIFGPGHYLRPTMFEPYQCRNVLVDGVTFHGSPFWTIHPTFCSNVTIRNVTVFPGVTNDDGCDPDSCQGVLMEGCSFYTADDNVSIKAGSGPDAVGLPACTDIVIRDCHCLGSGWSGFTMGSSTTGGIENVFIENCTANRCIAAFYVKSNSDWGGMVRNVWIRDSRVEHCHHLFLLQTDYDGIGDGPNPPLYESLHMREVSCGDASVSAFWFEGDPRQPIRDVDLIDIAIHSTVKLQLIDNTVGLYATGITLDGKKVTVAA